MQKACHIGRLFACTEREKEKTERKGNLCYGCLKRMLFSLLIAQHKHHVQTAIAYYKTLTGKDVKENQRLGCIPLFGITQKSFVEASGVMPNNGVCTLTISRAIGPAAIGATIASRADRRYTNHIQTCTRQLASGKLIRHLSLDIVSIDPVEPNSKQIVQRVESRFPSAW